MHQYLANLLISVRCFFCLLMHIVGGFAVLLRPNPILLLFSERIKCFIMVKFLKLCR